MCRKKVRVGERARSYLQREELSRWRGKEWEKAGSRLSQAGADVPGRNAASPFQRSVLAARKVQPLLLQQEPLGLDRGGSRGSRCQGFPFGAPRGTKSHRFPCQREPGGENNKKQKAQGGAGWSRADAEDGINQLSGRNIRALRLVVNAFSSFPKTDTMRDQGTFPIVTGDLSTRSSPMWKSLPAGSGRYLTQNMQRDGMGEGNGEKVERPEMMCPCLIDLGISRETVTIAARLQVQGSLWAEV